MIPAANPRAAYHRHQAEFDAAWRRVMDSGRYILGPEVEAFEAEFADWLGVRHAVGVASGTEALWLALRATGLRPGAEVITSSLTASATLTAIVEAGLRPVFADLDPATLTLDPAEVERRLTPATRALVPVHLYGNPADLTALAPLAEAHGLILIEDCAQAHGAQHAGRRVGTFGRAAAWSFYPTKNLGAFGDGGLVTTADDEVVRELRLLREYGWRERYHSAVHGWNSRLDELQAALLRVRLRHLEADNARRRAIAAAYRAGLPPALPSIAARPGDLGVEHLFVVRHPERDRLRAELQQAGVGTAIQYPVACHRQAAYAGFGAGPGSLPVTERAAAEVFSLPLFPELSDNDVAAVIAAVGALRL
ncbi:MAG: DegT/DnrJ/EryC1/StrS family aminotransferase [Anaerolineales bacterium]|nr:DegT/DnrJ/EryC1/StrS family aminotransferase [Anaerolineales bacterium]